MRNAHRRNWMMNRITGKMEKTSLINVLAFNPGNYDIDVCLLEKTISSWRR